MSEPEAECAYSEEAVQIKTQATTQASPKKQLMQGLRLHVYRYLTLQEATTKIAVLSKRERLAQRSLLKYLKKRETLFINTWNNKDSAY